MVCVHDAHPESTGIPRQFNNLSITTELKNRLSVDESDKTVKEFIFNLDEHTHQMIKLVLDVDDDDDGLSDDDFFSPLSERKES